MIDMNPRSTRLACLSTVALMDQMEYLLLWPIFIFLVVASKQDSINMYQLQKQTIIICQNVFTLTTSPMTICVFLDLLMLTVTTMAAMCTCHIEWYLLR